MMIFRYLLLSLSFLAVFPAFAADEKGGKAVYALSSEQSVSDLLFGKGILKTNDPAAVEEYVRIHHCGLYEQYARDDFAWARIREAQARTIDMMLSTFPDGLEVESALHLDRYDLASNSFLIRAEEQMHNVASMYALQLEMGNMTPCPDIQFSTFVPRVHPLTLAVKFDKPVTLKGLNMNRSTADALIVDMNKRPNTKREVTIVMSISVTGVDPLAMSDPLRRTVLGTLDMIRVYDTPERKTLLFKKDFESQQDSKGTN